MSRAFTITLCKACGVAHTLEQALQGKDDCAYRSACPMLKIQWTIAYATLIPDRFALPTARVISWRVKPVACCACN